MKPTQEQALDWAFECDFVESTPAEDVFSSIYVCCPKDIERLVTLAYETGRKDENEALRKDGWRQCAIDQKTTQFCSQLEQAVAAERELCAKICEDYRDDWLRGDGRYEFMGEGADYCAEAIRARMVMINGMTEKETSETMSVRGMK